VNYLALKEGDIIFKAEFLQALFQTPAVSIKGTIGSCHFAVEHNSPCC
jgi:hypothetical protein